MLTKGFVINGSLNASLQIDSYDLVAGETSLSNVLKEAIREILPIV